MFQLVRQMILACAVCHLMLPIAAGDEEKAVGEIPPGSEAWESSFAGTYFVPRDLKEKFETLRGRVAKLQHELGAGDLEPADARAELRELREELADVRDKIDRAKVLVSAFEIKTQTVEDTFELGPERLLVVTADKLRIVGWDKPEVKYVLKRIVLTSGEPAKEDLEAIELKHAHRKAPELVGKSDAQRQADEEKFLNSPDGKKLTQPQRANREKLLELIASGYRHLKQFQGRQVDTLNLVGLTHQEGNRHVSFELREDGTARQMGSRWRRHAEVTLYVPECTAIALRGCQVGLDATGVQGHLIVTSSGSQNLDYSGTFTIRDQAGPLTVDNAPVDLIENVEGDVAIVSTTELVNTGTSHSGGFRTAYAVPPRRCEIRNVRGNLTAHFTRSDLHIKGISNIVNVRNDYGDTELTVPAPLADGSHRIVSHSGRIRGVLAGETLPEMPLLIATNCGSLRTTLDRKQLESSNFAHSSRYDFVRRGWRAMHTPVADFKAKFRLFARPGQALRDEKRSPGLDLISRCGRVELIEAEETTRTQE